MNRRILMMIDLKHRDLSSISLIGLLLEELGNEVRYSSLGDERKVVDEFNPHAIIANKPIDDVKKLLLCKAEGRKRIVVDTEGIKRQSQKMIIKEAPDLYFFWNEHEMAKYNNEGISFSKELLGCSRIDFLHSSFDAIYGKKEEVLLKLDLDSQKQTVTIATHSTAALSPKGYQEFKRKQLTEVFETPFNFDKRLKNAIETKDITEEFIRNFISINQDVNFILKPHPTENFNYWKDIENSLQLSNFRVIGGVTINELLSISDIHVAHNGCTTSTEALMKGIPVIEIMGEHWEYLYPEERIKLVDQKAFNANTVSEMLINYFKNGYIFSDDHVALKSKIIEESFYRFDGLRCYNYAKRINEYLIEQPENLIQNKKAKKELERISKKKIFRYGIRFEFGALKNFILNKKLPKQKPLNKQRFDNLYKKGDEQIWIDKYSESEFNLAFFEKRHQELYG